MTLMVALNPFTANAAPGMTSVPRLWYLDDIPAYPSRRVDVEPKPYAKITT